MGDGGNDRAAFERLIGWIKSGRLQLPVYSPATMRIQQYLDDYAGDISAIEDLISSDQVLAVEVLRAANSPFYCTIATIDTIRNAIVRLGMQQVRRIVVLVSERRRYRSQYPDLDGLLVGLWEHVSATALSAQWLSQRLRLTGIREVCFLGGLLHDIGKLVILRAVDEMRRKGEAGTPPSPEKFREFISASHCQIGYDVLKRWEIPDIYCLVARDHQKQGVPADDLTLAIVRLANTGSLRVFEGADEDSLLRLTKTPEAKRLGVDGDLLLELRETLEGHKAAAA